ncbi:MOS1T transposase, partial [Pseudoatta argentina]
MLTEQECISLLMMREWDDRTRILNEAIIGPFFIEGNLNADNYLAMLQDEIVPAFEASLKSAAEAHRILVQTYGDNALSDTTCRDWFRRFKNNDFELEDKERSGAPKKFQDKELEQLLDEDPSQTLSELGKILQVDESTVSKRLKMNYYGGSLSTSIDAFESSLKKKRPLYAQRHDKVILLHDNTRPHVAKPVKTYLETLKWEVLLHPLNSPDIAPSDFHLFRSMAHGLADRRFHSYEEAQKWINSWIASKDMSFFRRGIHVLPERWSKVVESDGKYFH